MVNKVNFNKKQFEVSNWLFNTSLIVTIFFNSQITDPFNSPKFWALMLCTAAICGHVLTKKIYPAPDEYKFMVTLRIVLFLFLSSSIISSVASYSVSASIFGENFRRNGFLTILAFLVIFIGAFKFVRFQNISGLFKTVLLTSFIVGGYSLLQITKNDFVIWSNPNAIITTLGNTNYAGSTMSILSIIIFGQLFMNNKNLSSKIVNSVVFIILLFAIRATQARQGLLILIIGLSIIILSVVYRKNSKLGKVLIFLSSPLAFFSVLGMLQIGPLQDLLYKGSLTIRGYYWRAGLEMFLSNPLFGVGIDNYGKFFKEVREVNYPLNYGFSITSTNAHNIFIQYFATGGLIVGLSYLFLQIMVLYRSYVLIRKTNGQERMVAVTLFAGWTAFQAQSLISIENIGGSIWGWLLGGSLIGLSLATNLTATSNLKYKRKSVEIDWRAITPSILVSLITIFLVVHLYSGERNTYLTQSYTAPQSADPKVKELFKTYSTRALNSKFIDNDYKNVVLAGMFEMGYRQEALDQLKQINKNDPRNLDTLLLLAIGYEQIREFKVAIGYRQEVAKYDPWNAQNYLALGVVHKYVQDYESMQVMLDKILSFAANDPIAVTAKSELVKPTE